MQIDFHHAVTYVISRLAGLEHDAARIVAHSAQYVDDATNGGTIHFDNEAMYARISSAHKTLDYRNFGELANHQVWIPFHFLPGNDGLPAGQDPDGNFIKKLVCRPNSHVAQDMIRECIATRERPYGLYRLGVTMHVYADTWAHQGFAGVNHDVNHARDILGPGGKPDEDLVSKVTNFFVDRALPLGHGAVLSNPDKPYLEWGYTNGIGEVITRDNPTDFLEAAEHMCRAIRRYVAGDPNADVEGLPSADRTTINAMLRGTLDAHGEARHETWFQAIATGQFSFGPATVPYVAKGPGSWKHTAVGTEAEHDDDDVFPYTSAFLSSHWKNFHDALQAHRFCVLHDILPRYGMCAA